jgi:tRNA-2-methylthio-N6-dimethylallyladenosine synthase
MNQAESERLASFLERSGYEATARAEDADIIVLNSCVVRQSAETKVVNKIRSLRHLKELCRDKIIAVTGCLVNSETDQLKRDFPYVNYFFPGRRLSALI